MDNLIFFGDAVKALDDTGRVGGYLVRFSKKPNPRKDISGQYFTAKTYLGPKEGDGTEALFDHGFAVPAENYMKEVSDETATKLQEFADRTFQPLKTKRDAIGIFAETVLNLEDEYEKFIHSRVKLGKIGWSSGAPGHRVKINKDGEITRWPIAEGSLTPRPCEPLNRCFEVKSLSGLKFVCLDDEEEFVESEPSIKSTQGKTLAARLTQYLEDLVEDGMNREAIIKSLAREAMMDVEVVEKVLSGEIERPSDIQLKAFSRVLEVSPDQLKEIAGAPSKQTIKGMFAEAYSERQPDRWEVEKVLNRVLKDVARISKSSIATGTQFDRKAKIKEIISEYAPVLEAVINYQFSEFEKENTDRDFYLRSVSDLSNVFENLEGISPEEHSQLVVSAFKGITKRFGHFHQTRVKAGRVLSEKLRKEIETIIGEQEASAARLRKILDESQPMATETEKNAAESKFLRLQHEARQTNYGEAYV